MTELALSGIVFDPDVYPRSEWSQATVDRYAEALAAGDVFPAIALEAGTNRLLDGMHRARAHRQAERDTIDVDYHSIPAGVPVKLYAASLSTKHGDRIAWTDLAAIAREIAAANPDYSIATIAKYAGVTPKTVGKWTADITERRQALLAIRVLLLTRAGWKQTEVAEALNVSQPTISRIQNRNGEDLNIGEDLLREAVEGLPAEVDADAIVEEIRQERIFAQWSDEDRDLLKRLRDGETVVVSMRTHNNLIGWAETAGLYERVDRRSPWGNPFEMPDDGDRDTVIRHYEQHYLPHKPSLLAKLDSLRGKALGCWCAPEACHGDVLAAWAEGRGEQC
jgi:transcriptional regulator with XRE-family HTH domain